MHSEGGNWHWGFGFGHWGFGILFWIIVIVLIAAIAKYFFSHNEKQ